MGAGVLLSSCSGLAARRRARHPAWSVPWGGRGVTLHVRRFSSDSGAHRDSCGGSDCGGVGDGGWGSDSARSGGSGGLAIAAVAAARRCACKCACAVRLGDRGLGSGQAGGCWKRGAASCGAATGHQRLGRTGGTSDQRGAHDWCWLGWRSNDAISIKVDAGRPLCQMNGCLEQTLACTLYPVLEQTLASKQRIRRPALGCRHGGVRRTIGCRYYGGVRRAIGCRHYTIAGAGAFMLDSDSSLGLPCKLFTTRWREAC